MEQLRCQKCNNIFERPEGETWRTLCTSCFILSKEAEKQFPLFLCEKCNEYFHKNPTETWRKKCPACYKNEMIEKTKPQIENNKEPLTVICLKHTITELESKLKSQLQTMQEQKEEIISLKKEIENREQRFNWALPIAYFVKQNIKALLSLCHPDRHNCNATSNDITRTLILIRKSNCHIE